MPVDAEEVDAEFDPAATIVAGSAELPPIDETRAVLLDAWAEWDASCKRSSAENKKYDTGPSQKSVLTMERAVADHASRLGVRTTALRDVLACWRRVGLNRAQAVAAVEAGLDAAKALR